MSDPIDPESDPAHPRILSFADVKSAALRIEGGVIHTPLCEAKLSKFMDYEVYLKCENLQFTGSALDRGLRNVLSIKKGKSVIVPSNGNSALAAAYHGKILGVPVTVVMPQNSGMMKVQRCRELKAKVVLHGTTLGDCQKHAIKSGAGLYLNCSDQIDVLAGLGTVGLEIISQLPEADAVIVPVGGGGLLAGVLVACKKLKCSCLVYGAECSNVPTMMRTLQIGKRTPVPVVPTLAEELSASIVGVNSLATIKGKLDRMLEVDEEWIARAILTVLEREKIIVDGAGVCAVAAVMQGLVPELRGKRVVCVLSGGNVDTSTLVRVIQRGMAAAFRLAKFTVVLDDSVGNMSELMQILSCCGACVKSVATENVWIKRNVFSTSVKIVAETIGEDHCNDLKARIRDKFPEVYFTNVY